VGAPSHDGGTCSLHVFKKTQFEQRRTLSISDRKSVKNGNMDSVDKHKKAERQNKGQTADNHVADNNTSPEYTLKLVGAPHTQLDGAMFSKATQGLHARSCGSVFNMFDYAMSGPLKAQG